MSKCFDLKNKDLDTIKHHTKQKEAHLLCVFAYFENFMKKTRKVSSKMLESLIIKPSLKKLLEFTCFFQKQF